MKTDALDPRSGSPTTPTKIAHRIRRRGRGRVYTNKDFLDLASRNAVDQALARMVARGTLRRLGRGLYDFPRTNKRLRMQVAPDPDRVADALARSVGARVVPSGATAANRLGLTTQVPARLVYLTDGPARTVKGGNQTYSFRHIGPKDMAVADTPSGMLLLALKHLGKDALTEDVLLRLRSRLNVDDRRRLIRDSAYCTDWLREAARRLAEDASRG